MQLIGKYKDMVIIFDCIKESGGEFTFRGEFPSSETGTAIIELKAIDDAGNVGTRIDMIILVDFSSLRVRVLYNNFPVKEERGEFRIKEFVGVNAGGYFAKESKTVFLVRECSNKYGVVFLSDT